VEQGRAEPHHLRGPVEDHLVVELNGEELDTLTKNDQLDSYRREFRGRPSSWIGWYGPGDDSAADINRPTPRT
jgi:hypothetical protein